MGLGMPVSAGRPANPLRKSVTPAASHTLAASHTFIDARTGIMNATRARRHRVSGSYAPFTLI
jgi:hypothetical protein